MSSVLIFYTACVGQPATSTDQIAVQTSIVTPSLTVRSTMSPIIPTSPPLIKTATQTPIPPHPFLTPNPTMTSSLTATTAPPTSTQIPNTSTPSPTSEIATIATKSDFFRIYPIEINPEYAKFDLDTREIVEFDDLTADLEYHRDQGSGMTTYYIEVVNGAKSNTSRFYNETVRVYEDCMKHVAELISPRLIHDLVYAVNGEPLCVLTNQGRLALLIWQQGGKDWDEFQYIISIEPIITE